jgi:hypothetical protein
MQQRQVRAVELGQPQWFLYVLFMHGEEKHSCL